MTLSIRATLHPIIHSRIGTDTFVSRIVRLKEDPRFQGVGPEVTIVIADESEGDGEAEVWLNWSFVDFWKGNSCAFHTLVSWPCQSHDVPADTIQRSITADPNAISPAAAASIKSDPRLETLQVTIKQQNGELNSLRAELEQLAQARDYEVIHPFYVVQFFGLNLILILENHFRGANLVAIGKSTAIGS